MPNKPARPFRYPGCPHLANDKSGYCEQHRQQAQASRRSYDQLRGTASERGYDARWQRYRLAYLAEHPLCVVCEKEGRVTAATVVDHITSVSGPDDPLFWPPSNHQPLCEHHHNVKTASENGAFGNPPR